MIQVRGRNVKRAVAFIVFPPVGARNDAVVICTPYVILFLVRCPEGMRTECDIRLRDSQTPAPFDIGLRSYVSDLFYRRFRRFHCSS